MRFVDEIEVLVSAGKGGDGAVMFRREKFVPKGGPAGGDGGAGGHVILYGDSSCNTLSHLRYQRHLRAKNGVPGGKNNMHGARGESHRMRVPIGCVVFDVESGEMMGEIMSAGEELLVAEGGMGGRGNARFATPENRTPDRAEKGRAGEERKIRLELKLLADVGLLGLPSVGKSTLIRKISNATPKVADYPFTTLIPHLGVVDVENFESFVVADIPGLIVGASEGKGLGGDFLRHLSRTKVLVHLIEVTMQIEGAETDRDPIEDYRKLNQELLAYSEELASKSQVVVLNKIDLPYVRSEVGRLREFFAGEGRQFFALSSHTGEGVGEFVHAVYSMIK